MDYATPQTDAVITKTADNLTPRNVTAHVVPDRDAALSLITSLIPAGASVQTGASETLKAIGFIEHLKSETHDWDNVHGKVAMEKDAAVQAKMRKDATHTDVYLGSVHALTQDGEMLIASNTGSQLPNIAYGSSMLILVVGAQKIVPDLPAAFDRLEKHVVPLEDARMMDAYGAHTQLSKALIFYKEHPMNGRKVHVIIVKEALGF